MDGYYPNACSHTTCASSGSSVVLDVTPYLLDIVLCPDIEVAASGPAGNMSVESPRPHIQMSNKNLKKSTELVSILASTGLTYKPISSSKFQNEEDANSGQFFTLDPDLTSLVSFEWSSKTETGDFDFEMATEEAVPAPFRREKFLGNQICGVIADQVTHEHFRRSSRMGDREESTEPSSIDDNMEESQDLLFGGETTEMTTAQLEARKRKIESNKSSSVRFKYNEGYTNAVKRPIQMSFFGVAGM